MGLDVVVLPPFSCVGDVVKVSAGTVVQTLLTRPEATSPSLGVYGRTALTGILRKYSHVFPAPGDRSPVAHMWSVTKLRLTALSSVSGFPLVCPPLVCRGFPLDPSMPQYLSGRAVRFVCYAAGGPCLDWPGTCVAPVICESFQCRAGSPGVKLLMPLTIGSLCYGMAVSRLHERRAPGKWSAVSWTFCSLGANR